MRSSWRVALLFVGAAALVGAGRAWGVAAEKAAAAAAEDAKVFELRVYTTNEGKLEDLHKRFSEHTCKLFEKHGMENVGYWHPQDAPDSANTLIYIVAHKSRDAAKASWAAFQADPEWQKVASDSQKNGKIVAKVESVFLDPTDYSPMK